jgi:hypothetical protein
MIKIFCYKNLHHKDGEMIRIGKILRTVHPKFGGGGITDLGMAYSNKKCRTHLEPKIELKLKKL